MRKAAKAGERATWHAGDVAAYPQHNKVKYRKQHTHTHTHEDTLPFFMDVNYGKQQRKDNLGASGSGGSGAN